MIESPRPVAAPSGTAAPVPGAPASVNGSGVRVDDPFPFIARVGDVLAASLDLAVTLDGLVHLVVTSLADVCFVHLVDKDGRLRQTAMRASSPQAEVLGAHIGGSNVDEVRAHGPLREILASGNAHLQASVSGREPGPHHGAGGCLAVAP